MNNKQERDEDLANRFIDRTLTSTEIAEVNNRVETDKQFAEMLAFHVAMHDAFAEEEKNAVVEPPKKNRPINYLKYALSAAATILVLLFLWFTLQDQKQDIAKQKISKQEMIELRNSIQNKNTMGNSNQADKLIKEGSEASNIKAIDLLTIDRVNAIDSCNNNLLNYKLGLLQLYHQNGATAEAAIAPLRCIYDHYRDTYPEITTHLSRAYLWSDQEDLTKKIGK